MCKDRDYTHTPLASPIPLVPPPDPFFPVTPCFFCMPTGLVQVSCSRLQQPGHFTALLPTLTLPGSTFSSAELLGLESSGTDVLFGAEHSIVTYLQRFGQLSSSFDSYPLLQEAESCTSLWFKQIFRRQLKYMSNSLELQQQIHSRASDLPNF